MKQGGINKTIGLALVGTLLSGVSFSTTSVELATEEDVPTVKISAFARHVGNRIKYHYRVENETDQTVIAISIGRDNLEDDNPINDILELNSRPSGWNAKFGLPSSSYNSPNGWRASMTIYDEEAEEIEQPQTEQLDTEQPEIEEAMPYAITWEPLNKRSKKLLAGQYSTRFSVTVDEADVNFLTGHALIVFEGEEGVESVDVQEGEEVKDVEVATLSVPIELIDTTPPTLEVNLIPNEILLTDGDAPVAIKTAVNTQDDFDSMPRIRLEAISTEESAEGDDILDASFGLDDRYFKLLANPLIETDRTYVIYYSATDAAWNQTLTSSTITVLGAHTDEALETQSEYQDGVSPDGMLPEEMPVVLTPLESAPTIESAPLGISR